MRKLTTILSSVALLASLPAIGAPTFSHIKATSAPIAGGTLRKVANTLDNWDIPSYRGTPFLTKGNRAQRARQMAGMISKNG